MTARGLWSEVERWLGYDMTPAECIAALQQPAQRQRLHIHQVEVIAGDSTEVAQNRMHGSIMDEQGTIYTTPSYLAECIQRLEAMP